MQTQWSKTRNDFGTDAPLERFSLLFTAAHHSTVHIHRLRVLNQCLFFYQSYCTQQASPDLQLLCGIGQLSEVSIVEFLLVRIYVRNCFSRSNGNAVQRARNSFSQVGCSLRTKGVFTVDTHLLYLPNGVKWERKILTRTTWRAKWCLPERCCSFSQATAYAQKEEDHCRQSDPDSCCPGLYGRGIQEPGITDLGITESGITESGIMGGKQETSITESDITESGVTMKWKVI